MDDAQTRFDPIAENMSAYLTTFCEGFASAQSSLFRSCRNLNGRGGKRN